MKPKKMIQGVSKNGEMFWGYVQPKTTEKSYMFIYFIVTKYEIGYYSGFYSTLRAEFGSFKSFNFEGIIANDLGQGKHV